MLTFKNLSSLYNHLLPSLWHLISQHLEQNTPTTRPLVQFYCCAAFRLKSWWCSKCPHTSSQNKLKQNSIRSQNIFSCLSGVYQTKSHKKNDQKLLLFRLLETAFITTNWIEWCPLIGPHLYIYIVFKALNLSGTDIMRLTFKLLNPKDVIRVLERERKGEGGRQHKTG